MNRTLHAGEDGTGKWRKVVTFHNRPLYAGEGGSLPASVMWRAAVAARYVQFFEEDAKKRQVRKPVGSVSANLHEQNYDSNESNSKAADMFNVSARTASSRRHHKTVMPPASGSA